MTEQHCSKLNSPSYTESRIPARVYCVNGPLLIFSNTLKMCDFFVYISVRNNFYATTNCFQGVTEILRGQGWRRQEALRSILISGELIPQFNLWTKNLRSCGGNCRDLQRVAEIVRTNRKLSLFVY